MSEKYTVKARVGYYAAQLLLVLVVFLPLLFALVSSLRPLGDIYKYIRPLSWRTFLPTNITLDAYYRIFTEYKYGAAMANSVLVAAITVLGGVFINAMAGFAFAKFRFPCKRLLFVVVLFSFMVPFELISINLYAMMIDLGWIDTFKALIVPSIPNGMVIFLFRQYYQGFPDYMLESAKIDGLNWWQIFLRIVLPNSKTVCISSGLVLFINQWESFLWPVLVTRSPGMQTIQIALNSFRTQYYQQWDLVFAAAILAFLVPVCIIFPLQRFFVAGITQSGVKE